MSKPNSSPNSQLADAIAPVIMRGRDFEHAEDGTTLCPMCGTPLRWPGCRPSGTRTCYCPMCDSHGRVIWNGASGVQIEWHPTDAGRRIYNGLQAEHDYNQDREAQSYPAFA